MNLGDTKSRRTPAANKIFILVVALTAMLGSFFPLNAQETETKEKEVLKNPPYMKYFYVSLNASMTPLKFPDFYYSAIKVLDNVYEYQNSSISMDSEKRASGSLSFGGSLGFAFLTYQTSSITWIGDIEVGYAKYTFPESVETVRETLAYFDSSKPDDPAVEETKDLSFSQVERSLVAYSLLVKIGANFISGLDRLFFLLNVGLSYTERTFVSGLTKYYAGKLDMKHFEDPEQGDFGLDKQNGKWVRKNYPINLGLELRYYLLGNFSLNGGWMMNFIRAPRTYYMDDGAGGYYSDKTHDLSILNHTFYLGLSFVF